MTFDNINANESPISRLVKAASGGNLSHAYIFEGDGCVDKLLLANCFAKAILCENGDRKGKGCETCLSCMKINHGNHEDIFYVEKEGAAVKDEAIEELQERLKKKPFAGDRNIAVINDAGAMTLRAQNRLLKTLEEPPAGTVILLLADNAEALTQTILSRSAMVRFSPFLTPAYREMIGEAEALADMLLGEKRFYRIKSRVMALAEDREKAMVLLDALETVFGKRAVQEGNAAASKAVLCIEAARRDLSKNMHVGYTLKDMILKITEEQEW